MSPEGLRSRFEFYRKWFQTLLVKEFMNLPRKEQEKFLTIVEKFKTDCLKVHEEAKGIKEKTVQLKILSIGTTPGEEGFNVEAQAEGVSDVVRFRTLKRPTGNTVDYIIYSLDGQTWFSSKEELITGKVSK